MTGQKRDMYFDVSLHGLLKSFYFPVFLCVFLSLDCGQNPVRVQGTPRTPGGMTETGTISHHLQAPRGSRPGGIEVGGGTFFYFYFSLNLLLYVSTIFRNYLEML